MVVLNFWCEFDKFQLDSTKTYKFDSFKQFQVISVTYGTLLYDVHCFDGKINEFKFDVSCIMYFNAESDIASAESSILNLINY